VLAFAAALGTRTVLRERERGILRSAFGSYVDPEHLERILDAPEKYLALGGARKVVTLLFSDIQGYTGLSNSLPAETVIGLMREYLSAMTEHVRAHGGRVDKIMGDGIMAVFGDPVPNAEHAKAAVRVALEMQRTLSKLRAQWVKEGAGALAIRIGIATGEVFVGNIGSPGAKLEYTALGPTVNLAARLEGRAGPGGVLVSAATREAIGADFEVTPVPGLQLKGFAEPQDAFAVLGEASAGPQRVSG
jgi:adenylate cyclase